MSTLPLSAADPRYRRAIQKEQRQTDAIDRSIELLSTHPDLDPLERVNLMIALATLNRRNR